EVRSQRQKLLNQEPRTRNPEPRTENREPSTENLLRPTMHVISGKSLPRRTFLKAAGATVALPFLDSMVPAGPFRAEAAAPDRTRLVCIEEVHGLGGCNNWGAGKFLFAPETTGADFKLVADNPLSAIESYRDYMTIVSNTDCRNAEAMALPEIGG